MKYVKLFESWMQSINEEVKTFGVTVDMEIGNFANEESKEVFLKEYPYCRSAETFGAHIAKRLNEFFKGYKNEDKPKFSSKVQTSNVDIICAAGEYTNSFKFQYKKTTGLEDLDRLEPSDTTNNDYMFSIYGTFSTNVPGSEAQGKKITLGEAIFYSLFFRNYGDYGAEGIGRSQLDKLMEELFYISKNGEATKSFSKEGKRGKATAMKVSKMTVEEFTGLTTDAKLNFLKYVLSSPFTVSETNNDKVYFIGLTGKFSKEHNIVSNWIGANGRTTSGKILSVMFPFNLDSDVAWSSSTGESGVQGKLDPSMSVANIPVKVGLSKGSLDLDYSTNPKYPSSSAYAEKLSSNDCMPKDFVETTLAALIFGLSQSAEDVASGKIKLDKNQENLFETTFDPNYKAAEKNAEEAWKKKGGDYDITINKSGEKTGS